MLILWYNRYRKRKGKQYGHQQDYRKSSQALHGGAPSAEHCYIYADQNPSDERCCGQAPYSPNRRPGVLEWPPGSRRGDHHAPQACEGFRHQRLWQVGHSDLNARKGLITAESMCKSILFVV